MKEPIHALIIDDERLARMELIRLLRSHPDIEVVGEASGVAEAGQKILSLKPELLFLDIQLRGETGFDLLERVDFAGKIIFVTAWDQYAVQAFEVNALDYLLKPVSPERLARSVERLVGEVSESGQVVEPASGRPLSPIHNAFPAQRLAPSDVVFIRLGNKLRFQRVEEILLLRAQGPYTELFTTTGQSGLVHKLLKEWEMILPETLFLRVHRNTMINLGQVDEVEPWSNHAYRITLKGFREAIIVSRRYAKRLREWRG
ncbi:MAG: response regulator transcription factor [Bacteroidales bacterium]|nr:response regulator transcription factor [Bacteroidales bacterium]